MWTKERLKVDGDPTLVLFVEGKLTGGYQGC